MIRNIAILAIVLFYCLSIAAHAAQSCAPLSGVNTILSDQTKIVLVGEMHGTQETPKAFGDLICNLSLDHAVVVALEDSSSEQGILDKFMHSDGNEKAMTTFIRLGSWDGEDGRTSRAYLALHAYLQTLVVKHQILDVRAIQPSGTSSENFEERMAKSILEAQAMRPSAVLVVLLGNIHAQKLVYKTDKSSYKPAGAYLDPATTISLIAVDHGGYAWNCASDNSCGAHNIPPSTHLPRSVGLKPIAAGEYDGFLSTGTVATASPPAVQSRH